MRTVLLIVGSLLPVVATTTYAVSIVRGNTRPQRMTRFLLAVITAIMFASLWISGDTSGVWLALVSFLQAIFILALTFRKGIGGASRLDFVCLALCMAGLGLWLLSDQPWIGLIASIVADLIAIAPSLLKTVRLPHTELAAFYAIDVVAGIAILFAGPFTLQAMLFPVYIACINAVFVAAIVWPRRAGRDSASESV